MVTAGDFRKSKNRFFPSPTKIGSYCMVTVRTSSFFQRFGGGFESQTL